MVFKLMFDLVSCMVILNRYILGGGLTRVQSETLKELNLMAITYKSFINYGLRTRAQ